MVVGDPEQGGVVVGGDYPVVRQSMLTSSTLDTEACVEQSMALVELVAKSFESQPRPNGTPPISADCCGHSSVVPMCRWADIHFKPDAALEAVKWVEMVESTGEL